MATASSSHPSRPSLASRFAFLYFAIYFPFLPLERLPCVGALTMPWNDLFTGVVAWISERVFHLPLPFLNWSGSRIDSAYGYGRVACILIAAIIVSGLWCTIDRRKDDHARLGEWLRVWLRYAMANAMLYYGVAKLTHSQFPYPPPEKLVEPFGDASPMGLLWTFMGYSDAYNVFTGGIEFLAGLLLLFRRTATLGSLLVVAVMSNVVMLNLCYDVPIKLYSFHLLVMGVLLVAPDAQRLADVLILHRAIEPARFASHFAGSPAKRALAWGKAAYVMLLVYAVGATAVADYRLLRASRSPLYGIYDVESFARSGVEVPPLLTDKARWRRMTVSGSATGPAISIWSMKDERESFTATDDAERRTLSLESQGGKQTNWEYSRSGRDLVLRGHPDDATIEVKLRRVDESSIPLVSRGFHWASERVVNR